MPDPGDGAKRADLVRLAMLVGIAVIASGGIGYAFDESRAGSAQAVVGIGGTYLVLGAGAVAFGVLLVAVI